MKKLIVSICLISIFISCNDKKIKLPPSSFSRYISAFTYGVISIRSNFEIELQDAYKGNEKIGDEIKAKLFDFSPNIEGRTILKSNNKIVFIPNQPLKKDKAYQVNFKLKDAIREVDKEHEDFEYTIRTIKESAIVMQEGMNIIVNKKDKKVFDFKGKLITSDFFDGKEVEDKFKINTSHNIIWNHNNEGTEHDFTIKSLEAENSSQTIKMKIDIDNVSSSTGSMDIYVPSKAEFVVSSMTIDNNDRNKITIYFSENLAKSNEGMCSIDGKYNYTMSIDGNKMILYPNNDNLFGDVQIRVLKGTASLYGKKMESDVVKTLSFGNMKPHAEIIGNGNILVDNGGAFLPIKTVALHQIKVDIYKIYQNNVLYFLQNNGLSETYNTKRFGKKVYSEILKLNGKSGFTPNKAFNYNLDLTQLVNLEKGAIYQVRLSFDKSMAASSCGNNTNRSDNLFSFSMANNFGDSDDEREDEMDYEYYYPDEYDYDKKDDPCDDSYYNYERFTKKNILVSNIGLIAKKGTDDKVYVNCVDLLTAKPMSGADIEVFNYQMQSIGKQSTNGDGYCEISPQDKPYFVVASNDGQKMYIKLENSLSQATDVFDVEGNHAQDGMKCFVYGERGVWRPGDKIYLTMILSNGYEKLPKDLPCQMELLNPLGQVFDKQMNNAPLNGFYSFMTKTATDAVTGNWTARFKVGGLRYDKIVKIETVKPNRLRIVSDNTLEYIQKGQTIKYQTSWLNGAVSSGLNASVDVKFFNADAEFKNYSKYNFNDRTKQFSGFEQTAYSGSTGSDGSFQFNFNMEAQSDNIPGMLNAVFTTKVFEGSGEFSIQYDTKKASFYNSYAGHRLESQEQYYLECNKNYNLHLVNLNAAGQIIPNGKLKLSVYRIDYHWWYNSYNSNRYFDESNIKETVIEKEVMMQNGKLDVPIFINKSKWGNYLIKVTDIASQHSSSSFVYFETPYGGSLGENRESSQIIQISKDKDKYNVGETVKLNMVSYFEGRALMSIENGNAVLKTKWFDLHQGKNELSFEVEDNMSPNVYAHITAIQEHKNTYNNLPIRMYGIIPITVNNEDSRLNPVISSPAKIEPENKLSFSVSEKNNKSMTYTVAIVDEGLLGISGYRTPEPWKFFYGKEALGVLTWDIFDHVIGAFTGLFQDVFAIGGDQAAIDEMNKAKSNRFESVVKYLGPFELHRGSNTHTIDIPNYVGNLKIMVVAGGDKYSFGQETKDVQVAKPLMVLGTLPRVLSLEEEVELPVNVFVTEKTIKDVNIKISADNKFTIIDEAVKSMHFASPTDQITNFKLKTKNLQGVGKISIIATSGKYRSTYDIDIPIQISNPPTIDYEQIVLNPHETKTIQINPLGVPGTNKIMVESSSIPELNIKSKFEQLIAYPHGCLEQTTSAIFPQLYIGDLMTVSTEEKNQMAKNIQSGFERYKSFQTSTGGLSYWMNSNYTDDYAGAYATHFMLEAKRKGYNDNPEMLKRLIDVMYSAANSFNPNVYQYEKTKQAYRLYVLALADKPNLGAMNRLKEVSLDAGAKIKLALAYSKAGKKDIAANMVSNITNQIIPYIDDKYTYGSEHLDNSFLLELYLSLGNKGAAYTTFRQCVATLNSKSYLGTQTTAGLLRAVSMYLSKYKPAPVNIAFQFNGKSYTMAGDKPVYSQSISPVSGTMTLTNNSNAISVVNIIRKGVELSVPQQISDQLGLSVEYVTKDGKPIDKSNITRQTDFKQIIRIINHTNRHFSNLALSNYIPSGWEIINNRIGGDESNSKLDYQDIRDDRVLSYFGMTPGETKIIIQDLNASYEGNYLLPALTVESMYHPSMRSSLASSKTVVKR